MTVDGWIGAAVAGALIGGVWFLKHRRFLQERKGIEKAVAELAEGREPGGSDGLADRIAQIAQQKREDRDHLSHEAENLRTILQSMGEGVMVVDSKHVIRFVNPAFKTILSVTTDPIGETVLNILKDAAFEGIVAAVLKTGGAQDSEVTRNGAARSPQYFAVSAMPLREARGNAGVVMIFRDITRLRQLEDVRKEFVANVSHELRTPLSIFQGYVETLIDNPDLPPEDTRSMLEIMRRHSRRLNALLDDLLILARLESRDDKLHLAPVDVAKFLREAVADWSLRSAEKKITLSADLPPGLPMISADAFRLEQVLGNLIDNSIKYTNSGGCVIVRAAPSTDGVEIRVEDSGLGIPPADLPRIFERFYRADKGRSREHGGTGLGLSIVKHIVLAHGGTVRAESEHGKGTSIVLWLPTTTPAIPAATPPSA